MNVLLLIAALHGVHLKPKQCQQVTDVMIQMMVDQIGQDKEELSWSEQIREVRKFMTACKGGKK